MPTVFSNLYFKTTYFINLRHFLPIIITHIVFTNLFTWPVLQVSVQISMPEDEYDFWI